MKGRMVHAQNTKHAPRVPCSPTASERHVVSFYGAEIFEALDAGERYHNPVHRRITPGKIRREGGFVVDAHEFEVS